MISREPNESNLEEKNEQILTRNWKTWWVQKHHKIQFVWDWRRRKQNKKLEGGKERFFHYLYLSFFNSRVSWLFLILCFSSFSQVCFKIHHVFLLSCFWIFWSQRVELWAKKSASFWVPVTYAILIWFVISIAPRSPNKALKFNSPHALSTHCNPTPKTLSFQNFRDSSPTHLSRFLLHTKFLENRLELEFGLSPFRVCCSVFSKSLMLSFFFLIFVSSKKIAIAEKLK